MKKRNKIIAITDPFLLKEVHELAGFQGPEKIELDISGEVIVRVWKHILNSAFDVFETVGIMEDQEVYGITMAERAVFCYISIKKIMVMVVIADSYLKHDPKFEKKLRKDGIILYTAERRELQEYL